MATNLQTSTKFSVLLFLFTYTGVFYGMGATFIESFVNYPTWHLIGADEFQAYHQALSPLVIRYMVIPLQVTLILKILLFWFRPAPIPRWAIGLCIVLTLVAWVSTLTIQVPIQLQLSNDGLSVPLIEKLIVTNWWLRRVPLLINNLLFFWMMTLLLKGNYQSEAKMSK